MSLEMLRPVDSGWNATIRRLESALDSGDIHAVASVGLSLGAGPVPAELVARAHHVLSKIDRLSEEVGARLEQVGHELNHASPRSRFSGPPAPSQLDCSA